MKILLVQKFIALVCLLLTGFCSSEEFKITRDINDYFTIPSSKCDRKNHTFDCGEYNAVRDRNSGNCHCVCKDQHATFSFHQRSCLRNKDARKILGCSKRTFFKNENTSDKLRLLGKNSEPEISLNRAGKCVIDTSWYIGCDGEKKVIASVGRTFKLEWEADKSAYFLEVDSDRLENSPLIGRIVKLGISCSSQGLSTNQNSCLLFKLKGRTNCPVTSPRATATTINDTVIKTVPPVPPGLSSNPSQVLSPPTPAADQTSDDVSTLSFGLIMAVTFSILLVIIIVGLFIYRQYSARKQTHMCTSTGSSQSDSGSPPGVQNAGYATITSCRSIIYASNYDVPNGEEVSTSHAAEGPSSEEPFYSTVDELFPNGPETHGPLSVEQRVYNMIEVLDTDTSDGPYGSNEGFQDHAPLSVEQRVYNMIEVLDTETDEEPNSSVPKHSEHPVYNVLEEPLPSGVGEVDRKVPSSRQDPMYNVLEGPDLDQLIQTK